MKCDWYENENGHGCFRGFIKNEYPKHERMIVKGIDDKYYFFDYPEDYERFEDGVVGYVDINSQIDCHNVIKSAVWEDTTGYVDELQNEIDLPDVTYLVTWYEIDDNCDLIQRAEFNLRKYIK